MLAYLRVPLGWLDIAKRTVHEALADDIFDLAAQQAYYFFFALFPALLFVIGIASFFPLTSLINDVVTMLSRFAPQAVIQIITDTMASLSKQNSGGVLTFGFLVTIWSSSGAMVSITTTLNRAYDVTESRPWWKTRLTAVGLTDRTCRLHPGVDVPGHRGTGARRTSRGPDAPRSGVQVGVVGAAVAGGLPAGSAWASPSSTTSRPTSSRIGSGSLPDR